jgi:hypothetical protein
MGYTTEFKGSFLLDRKLDQNHFDYLNAFSTTRRMRRNAKIAEKMEDSARINAGLPIGFDAEYFVGSRENFGQEHDSSIISYNSPSITQPSLWCQWVPSEDYNCIEWDGSEKFYHYNEWIQYMIDNFFIPWKYILNGYVIWNGERSGDIGKIKIDNNIITIKDKYLKAFW